MPLPDVAPSKLLAALKAFDARYRHTREWGGWELNQAYKFAADHGGRRYPVKMVVALATGMARRDFSGGMARGQAGWFAAQRGLTVIPLRPGHPHV